MFEKIMHVNDEKARCELKKALSKSRCSITAEDQEHITVVHGSVWGSSPESAKKKVVFSLKPEGEDTRISSVSSLDPAWVLLNLAFFVIAAFLIFSSWVVANDLETSVLMGYEGSWMWLAESLGFQGSQEIIIFAAALRFVTIIIIAGCIGEILLTWYIYAHRGFFAQKTLESIVQKEKPDARLAKPVSESEAVNL